MGKKRKDEPKSPGDRRREWEARELVDPLNTCITEEPKPPKPCKELPQIDPNDRYCSVVCTKKKDRPLEPSLSERGPPHCPPKTPLLSCCDNARSLFPNIVRNEFTDKLRIKFAKDKEEYIAKLPFCRPNIIKVPSLQAEKEMVIEQVTASAEMGDAGVMPEIYSDDRPLVPKKREELLEQRPQSKIFLEDQNAPPAVSPPPPTDMVFPRPGPGRTSAFGPIQQPESEIYPMECLEEFCQEEEAEEEGPEEAHFELNTEKLMRRKVSMMSVATSIHSKDYNDPDGLAETIQKLIQKYTRDSEQTRYVQPKRKVKRGTFQSHSWTDLTQPTLKSFYFGIKLGTMHQGDINFPPEARNNQGICVPVAAYCMAVLKHPDKWGEEDIDEVLEGGTKLYLASMLHHVHDPGRELSVNEIAKYCYVSHKKIRFQISEPEMCGCLRSTDKRIFNITKALNLLFQRKKSALLVTDAMKLIIWKDRHFYFFDGQPRTIDLSSAYEGAAMLAYFYDLPSVITVILEKSGLENPAFVLYSIDTIRILEEHVPDTDSKDNIPDSERFKVVSDKKAVLMGSFDLADRCFGFTRNKQAVCIVVVALVILMILPTALIYSTSTPFIFEGVYAYITGPSSWVKKTVDKIMLIGNQLFLECMKCDDLINITVDDLPAIFTIGPYVIEIHIWPKVIVDLMYKKKVCTLNDRLGEFFSENSTAILQIDKYSVAIWKDTCDNLYYMFDPYPRNMEGIRARCGEACASMFQTLGALCQTLEINFDNQDYIFHIHCLKVLKLHRDPDADVLFPTNVALNDLPMDAFKTCNIKKCKHKATAKMNPVTVDFTQRAIMEGEVPKDSVIEIGSNIRSIKDEHLPPMMSKWPSRCNIEVNLGSKADICINLDSRSLSDTQIEPPKPKQPEVPEQVGFVDLGSYDLLMEDYLLACAEGIYEEGGDMGEEEGEEGEWYMAVDAMAQVHSYSLNEYASRTSAEVNTDLTYFCIPKEEVPAPIRADIVEKTKQYKTQLEGPDDLWQEEFEPEVTQSEELLKPSNFVDLPDNCQVIHGSKNMAEFGTDIEFMAPFICIIAAVVARKYKISTWSKDILDYILNSGVQLYNSSDTRYDQVYRLEIPRIVLGRTDFAVKVCYVFDSYLKASILETTITKVLFARSNAGILATPSYSCLVYYRNHLYYLFDGFANNEVGLGTGPENQGVACILRFKTIHNMVNRIIYNKSRREVQEDVEYNRFVLSAVFIRRIPKVDALEQRNVEERWRHEVYPDDAEDKLFDDMGEEMNAMKKPIPRPEPPPKQPKNKVGWQYVDEVYKIEGSIPCERRKKPSEFLEMDYFACLCANLMLLNHPLNKWDTRKVDQVIEQGKLVYSHAVGRDVDSKKFIQNVLIDDYFFSVVAKEMLVENWDANRNLRKGMQYIIQRGHRNIILQFNSRAFSVFFDYKAYYIFDPNLDSPAWIKFPCYDKLLKYIDEAIPDKTEAYHFHQFEVTAFMKAPRCLILKQRMQRYKMQKGLPKCVRDPDIEEKICWIEEDPIPWSQRNVKQRSKWGDWNVETPEQVWTLYGNLSQFHHQFEKYKGRQTFAVYVCALAMTQIYEFSAWNADTIDGIVRHGTKYLMQSLEERKDRDSTLPLELEDLNEEYEMFPYKFSMKFVPLCDGHLFTTNIHKFSLARALRYLFKDYDKRFGLVIKSNNGDRRIVAFGKLSDIEYFMFDTECNGPPIFLNHGFGAAYVVRTRTLQQLLRCLVHILRNGHFFMFDIGITKPAPVIAV